MGKINLKQLQILDTIDSIVDDWRKSSDLNASVVWTKMEQAVSALVIDKIINDTEADILYHQMAELITQLKKME
jgi:hypothetical protein